MMNEILDAVLDACRSRTVLPDLRNKDFSLIAFQNFDASRKASILRVVNSASSAKVKINLIGGGFGCARFNFDIDAESESDRAWKLWRLIQSEDFKRAAREADIRVLITYNPDARIDLVTGVSEGLKKNRGLPLFCSYSHRDRYLHDELRAHLAALEWMGLVSIWYDGEIPPGTEFDPEIATRLRDSDLILFLVSSYFFASDYIRDKEIPVAMHRHEVDQAAVIPIILRPVDWRFTPLGKIKALPLDGAPVTDWPDLHSAFANVAEGVRKTATARLQKKREALDFPATETGGGPSSG